MGKVRGGVTLNESIYFAKNRRQTFEMDRLMDIMTYQ